MARNKEYYLIVDGYNIIHNWPELMAMTREDIAGARESLVDTMAEYAKSSGVNVMVVFDAYDARGSKTHIENKGIDVIFTEENQTADEYIERLIDRIGRKSRRNEIRVASSDGMIQNIILGRGAVRVSAAELKQMVMDQDRVNQRLGDQLKKDQDKYLVGLDEENLKVLDQLIEEQRQEKKKKD